MLRKFTESQRYNLDEVLMTDCFGFGVPMFCEY